MLTRFYLEVSTTVKTTEREPEGTHAFDMTGREAEPAETRQRGRSRCVWPRGVHRQGPDAKGTAGSTSDETSRTRECENGTTVE